MRRLIPFITRYLYSLFACFYLFTFGVFREKNRLFLSQICSHFGCRDKRSYPLLPIVGVSQIVPENLLVEVRESFEVDGNISLAEIVLISKIIKVHNPRKLFEIGTFDGRTTLNMAANCSKEAKVYTLDLPKEKSSTTQLPIDSGEQKYIEKENSGSRYLGTDCEAKITQLYGDSATFDFSPFLDTMDFVFIDGAHSYEYVLNDSKQALKLLKGKKGLILWHDYDKIWWEGVTIALDQLYLAGNEFKDIRRIDGTSLVYLIRD